MKKIVCAVALLLMSTLAIGADKWPIRQDLVQNPTQLRQLLQNRFDLVEADIAELQVTGSLGRAEVFYVCSVTGSATYTGEDVDHPLATLDAAVGKCTANRGDIIIVLQNHAETLAGADAVDIDVAGVTVIGLGSGTDRPTFTFDTDSDEFVIGANGDNVTIYNLVFFPSVSECVHGVDVESGANNVAIINCEFMESATAANEFNKMITLAGTTLDLLICNCRFISADEAGASTAIEIGDGVATGLRILNNTFYGDWDPAPIWSDQINVNVNIENNIIYNANAGEYGIEFTQTTNVGAIRWNTIITNGTYIDAGGLAVNGNFYKTIGDSDTDSWTFDLGTNNLDHLMKTVVADDAGAIDLTEVVDKTVLSWILSGDGDTATFIPSTMALSVQATNLATVVTSTTNLEALSTAALAQLGQAGVTLGKVWYVDSTTGDDADTGATWALAEATLGAAIADCTNNKGDVIFIAPNHTETLANAQLDIAAIGVRIIGLGVGTNRPEFIFSHANSSWDISGSNLWIENLIFRATITGVLIGVDFDNDTAHFNTLKNCLFEDSAGGGGEEFISAVNLVAGADFITIEDCEFQSPTAGAATAIASNTGVCDRITVKNCRIFGDYSTAAISTNQTHTGMYIADNVISNYNSGNYAIELTGAPTGQLVNNRLYADAYATTLDPGSLLCIGNLAVDAIDEGGYVIPVLGDSTNNYVGINSANNDADTSTVVANANGSIAERLEAIQTTTDPYFGHPNYFVVSATFDATTGDAHWGNSGESDEFCTVTGACRVRILMECTGSLTDGGDTATLSLLCGSGVIIAATTCATVGADATQIATGEIWVDTSPTELPGVLSSAAFIDIVVTGGLDIGVTTAGEDITGGTIKFHVWWTALDATGLCAAATGASL